MVYDGDGHRVSRTAIGVTTRFLVDDLTPTGYAQVAEELVGGAVAVRYTHGVQRVSQSRADVTHFYGYDGGGSVRQLTDTSGAVTDTYTFDGFGVLIGGTGSTVNAYRYRGEQWDASVAMYYLRTRYFTPHTGRFMTLDTDSGQPTDPRTLHLYYFAGNNPVGMSDHSGRTSSAVRSVSHLIQLYARPVAQYPPSGASRLAEPVCFLGNQILTLLPTMSSGRFVQLLPFLGLLAISTKLKPIGEPYENHISDYPTMAQIKVPAL